MATLGRDDAHRVLDALLDSAREPSTPVPYYTQDNSPLGKRAHLEAVRSGKLAGWKVGRLIYAKRDDVHRYIEAHPVKPKQKQEPGLSEGSVDSWLAERGIH